MISWHLNVDIELAAMLLHEQYSCVLQNISIDEHLAVVERQIKEAMPDENFNGIAVIDIEQWRPLYEMNWGEKIVRLFLRICFLSEGRN